MNDGEAPTTAADIRLLAEEAEAEAAEAEAMAAAARARVRAIQLRRQAEFLEAEKEAGKTEPVTEQATEQVSLAVDVIEGEADSEAEPAEGPAEVDGPDSGSGDEAEDTVDESESVEAEESADDTAAEDEVEISPDEDAQETSASGLRRLGRRVRGPRWSTVAAALAIVVSIAALVLSGLMIKAHHDAAQRRQRAAEFVAAARQGVVTLTSLDFNTAQQGVQRILDNSTGSFKDDFEKMKDDFTKVVEQSKVVSQGSVQAAAVDLDTMTDDSAVVLVASTSEVTNAAGAKQDPRSYRLIVTVTRDGGQLKISKVEFVP